MAELWKPQPMDVYIGWIEDIETEASDNLSDWETSFITNIQSQLMNQRNLTQLQAEKLEQIYVKHTK